MKEKLKNDRFTKDLFYKLLTIVLLAAMGLLFFDVLTESRDGRKQVADLDGGEEVTAETAVESAAAKEEQRLENILSQIKGVGEVQVMLVCREENSSAVFASATAETGPVTGVIVVAEGAGSAAVRSNIIDAVKAAYDLPADSVTVFESRE
ncbi:MAG: hypothetical protein Q4C22_02715 [Bacillota bacterium]|nr:hypothetical protein [Bacillota bacterium]